MTGFVSSLTNQIPSVNTGPLVDNIPLLGSILSQGIFAGAVGKIIKKGLTAGGIFLFASWLMVYNNFGTKAYLSANNYVYGIITAIIIVVVSMLMFDGITSVSEFLFGLFIAGAPTIALSALLLNDGLYGECSFDRLLLLTFVFTSLVSVSNYLTETMSINNLRKVTNQQLTRVGIPVDQITGSIQGVRGQFNAGMQQVQQSAQLAQDAIANGQGAYESAQAGDYQGAYESAGQVGSAL